MEKKYELTEETKEYDGHTLHRIRALMDMPLYNVKKGDLGGWIESEANLSQEGNCWVVDAMVYGNACVYSDAYVYGDAWVSGRAKVSGDAWVSGRAKVSGDAWVSGRARVYDRARVSGDAWVSGRARVYGDASVCGNARVFENACVYGNAYITGDAVIKSNDDFIAIDNIGSRFGATTAFRTKDHSIKITCGCFYGTLDKFKDAVMKTHKDNNKYRNEYLFAIKMIKAHFYID